MSTLDQDLAHLNFEYLMLARECARNNALEAAWRFGVDRKQIRQIAKRESRHVGLYRGAVEAPLKALYIYLKIDSLLTRAKLACAASRMKLS